MVGGSSSASAVGPVAFYRSAWYGLRGVRKASILGVVGFAFAVAGLFATGVLSPEYAGALSSVSTSTVAFATGVLFIVNGAPHKGQAGAAWSLIGLGLVTNAIGEAIYQFHPDGTKTLLADAFFLSVYPLMFTGALLLPHINGRRWERVQLTIDCIAGSIAVAAIAWIAFLGEALETQARSGGISDIINLLYPVGDTALLIAVLILATRRSAYQFDGRLVTLWMSLAISIAANSVYAIAIEQGTYRVGQRTDALWLLGFGLAAVTTLFLAGPQRYREIADRPVSLLTMIAPYTAVGVLFAATMREIGSNGSVLQFATAVVVALIIARQTVAIREVREVVEKQRTDLVAAISHELRTPLAAIGGFIEIMADDPDIEHSDRVEMVDMVRDQTRHLTRIVEDMIELSRDKLSSSTITHQPVDVAELVRSSLDLIPDLTLDVRIDLPEHLAMSGDEGRLRQILVNYLVNASRYGGGAIAIVGERKGAEVVLEVHDNGPGVAKKYEITIWDRFERGANTYLSAVQGSGLGLAIVRQLATAHGGTVGYRRSEILGGSCFWVSVPIR